MSEVLNRPSFDEIYTKMAKLISERSTNSRTKVGCLIVSEDYSQVYSVGYNGNYTGGPNSSDSETPGESNDIHAEQNAMIKCSVSRETKKRVYVTHSPCVLCAKMLVNMGGVVEVIYNSEYRVSEGLDILRKTGILVKEFTHGT